MYILLMEKKLFSVGKHTRVNKTNRWLNFFAFSLNRLFDFCGRVSIMTSPYAIEATTWRLWFPTYRKFIIYTIFYGIYVTNISSAVRNAIDLGHLINSIYSCVCVNFTTHPQLNIWFRDEDEMKGRLIFYITDIRISVDILWIFFSLSIINSYWVIRTHSEDLLRINEGILAFLITDDSWGYPWIPNNDWNITVSSINSNCWMKNVKQF